MKRMMFVLVLLGLAALACGPLVAPFALPFVPTATAVPTPTPVRMTTDAECQADWEYVLGESSEDTARDALSYYLGHREELLPGSVGEYLVTCVDEGWRGYFDEPGQTGSSG